LETLKAGSDSGEPIRRVARLLLEPERFADDSRFAIVGFGLVLAWVSIGFALTTDVTMDDSFIVFRVVDNWLGGGGPRFNPGDSHFIVTSPLWLGILTAAKAGLPGVAIPGIAHALVWLLLVVSSCMLFALLRDDFPIVSVLAPAAIFYTPSMASLAGHDTACALTSGLALLLSHRRDRPNALAIAAGLTYLARGEGAVLAAIVGGHYLLRAGFDAASVGRQIRRMGPGLAVSLICVGGWHAYYLAEFGALFPATLAAKIAQGSFAGSGVGDAWTAFAVGLPDHLALIAGGYGWALMIAGFAVLTIRCWPLALWPLSQVAIYAGLGVPYYHWYAFPVELVGVVAMWIGVEVAFRLAARLVGIPASSHPFAAAVVLGVAVVVVPCVRGPMVLLPGPVLPALRSVTAPDDPGVDLRFRTYQQIAARIRRDPDAANRTLLASEIGILGYALPSLSVVDTVGLTDPAVPSGRFFDYHWHIEHFEPEYLVLFYGAADRERFAIALSDGRVIRYARTFVPPGGYRAAALFERVDPR